MLVAVVAIQSVLILYLFLWRAVQREQTLVLTHFVWSLFEGSRSSVPAEQHEQWFQRFVDTAAEEMLDFAWIGPLESFTRRKRLLFFDDRYGRFGMHAYPQYFDRIVRTWDDAKRKGNNNNDPEPSELR